ncbi:MAG: hypothetical protein L0229_21140 [Blastocatellia bacterium]|nr:hypothetical protein [Blastocatellia bacterium]
MKRKPLLIASLIAVVCGLGFYLAYLAGPHIPLTEAYVHPQISAEDFPGITVETGKYTIRAQYRLPGDLHNGLAVFGIPEGSLSMVELDFASGSVEFDHSKVDFDGLEEKFVELTKQLKASGSVDPQGASLPLTENLANSACALQIKVDSPELSFVADKGGSMTLLRGFSLSNPVMEMPGRGLMTAPARVGEFSTIYKELGNLPFAKSISIIVTSGITRVVNPFNVTVESTGTFVIKAEE